MSDLRSLQRRFQDYLRGSSDAIEKDIVSTSDALAEHRLGTYFNAYRIRLIDCLAIEFSGLHQHLGQQAFENLALNYLKHYPSSHPSVRWFGEDLVEYLRSTSDLEDRDFLSELARFEWTKGLVFDDYDSTTPYSIEDMAQVPQQAWPGIQVEFIAAMRWLDFYSNACPYWVALDNSETLPTIEFGDYPVRWLVWRKKRNPYWRSLEAHEAWAIEAAVKGADFSDICEGLCEWISEDQVALIAAGFLKQWISDELITRVNYE
jgi:hypothetical protein